MCHKRVPDGSGDAPTPLYHKSTVSRRVSKGTSQAKIPVRLYPSYGRRF